MACEICKSHETLFEIPDGTLNPEVSTYYGGVSFLVSTHGIDNHNAVIAIDGMWADGISYFGCCIPIRFCPWCGEQLDSSFEEMEPFNE